MLFVTFNSMLILVYTVKSKAWFHLVLIIGSVYIDDNVF